MNEIMNEQDETILKFDYPLLEKGVIDSMAFIKLVAFLEKKFNLSLDDLEVVQKNCETIQSISNFVKN